MKTKHYHSKDIGCELENKVLISYDKKNHFEGSHCKTHNVDCCRCGKEFGYHFEKTNEKEI